MPRAAVMCAWIVLAAACDSTSVKEKPMTPAAFETATFALG